MKRFFVGVMLVSMTVSGEETNKVLKAGDEYLGIQLAETRNARCEVITNQVTVHESDVINRPDIGMLGYNHNWLWNDRYMTDLIDGQLAPNPDYLKIAEGIPFPLNRVSGSQSQRFRWKEAIGPYDQRIPQKLTDWAEPVKLKTGPVEWVKMIRQLDLSARTIWVVNMMADSAQDNADLVEFLTGDGKTNPNGGVNWAQRRIELGIAEPVYPALIEMGNELDWGKERSHYPVDRYITECRERMAAMREVWPDVKFSVHAASAPWSKKHEEIGGWRNWHLPVLKALGDQVDFISIHPYYHGMPVSKIERDYMRVLMDDIRTVTGSDRIKIYVSEHARWPKSMAHEDRYQTRSLEGALATGEWLNRMLQYPQIRYMTYHCLSGGPWGLIYQGENSFYRTAMADFFRIYNEAFGDDVLRSEVTGQGTVDDNLMFTANVMRADDELRLLLVNREATARRLVRFDFEGDYQLVRKTVFTGSYLDAVNDDQRKEVMTTTEECSSPGLLTSCEVPARSMVVLYLKPAVPSVVTPAETVRDLPPHYWGQNANLARFGDWRDERCTDVLKRLHAGHVRYPAGTLANYWDWKTGQFIEGLKLPYGLNNAMVNPYTLEDLNIMVERTGAVPVFVLNMLHSGLETQLEMLREAQRIGLPILYVELGNEFYLSKPDNIEKYPTPEDYAADANRWAAAIRREFPKVKLAALGAAVRSWDDERRKTWNERLFPLLEGLDAAVIHVYSGAELLKEKDTVLEGAGLVAEKKKERPTDGRPGYWASDEDQLEQLNAFYTDSGLVRMLGMPVQRWADMKDLKCLPEGMDVWVTEYGFFDRIGPVRKTWANGLFIAAFSLQSLEVPQFTKATYHSTFNHPMFSAVHGDDNAFEWLVQNDLIAERPESVPFNLTPSGMVLSLVGRASDGMTKTVPLRFSNNPEVTDGYVKPYGQLYGTLFFSDSGRNAVLLNLSGNSVPVNLSSSFSGPVSVEQVTMESPRSYGTREADYIKEASDSFPLVQLKPYSISLISQEIE